MIITSGIEAAKKIIIKVVEKITNGNSESKEPKQPIPPHPPHPPK